MLDTIILQIPINYSAIIDHSQSHPSTVNVLRNQKEFRKYINNPTKEDKEKWRYMPRLTIIKRGDRIYLKIEFSARLFRPQFFRRSCGATTLRQLVIHPRAPPAEPSSPLVLIEMVILYLFSFGNLQYLDYS